MFRSTILGLLAACSPLFAQPRIPAGLKVEETVDSRGKTKVLFIAGTSVFKPGEHDYIAGCADLMKSVSSANGVVPVLALDWPSKAETWNDVAAVVFFFDGADKHQAVAKGRAAKIDDLVARGTGLVQLHQAADYPDAYTAKAITWAGGAWKKGMGKRAHWVETFKTFPSHPVFAGVGPFAIDDGWLWNIKFVDEMKGITPLLRTVDPKKKDDPKADSAIVSWAYNRPDGGKSVTFTGGHLHKSLQDDNYRRFLTNAILWTTGRGVELEKKP